MEATIEQTTFRASRGRAALAALVFLAATTLGAAQGTAQTAAATDIARGADALKADRPEEALAILRPLAEQGDADAQFLLGVMHENGQGVAPDADAALAWYRQAALRGHPEAQLHLGAMLAEGRGADRDRRAASVWYARAALGGEPRGAFRLAQLYEAGAGVPSSPRVALAWYEFASSGVRAGAARRDALAEIVTHTAAPPPAPTLDAAPTLVATDDGAAAALVWFPGDGAAPGRFFVEVAALGDGPPQTVYASYSDVTAALAPLPDAEELYVWRVFSVSDGGVYSSGGWRRLRPEDDRATPSLAQGMERHGLSRYDVTVRYGRSDTEAAEFGEGLVADLALANIFVSVSAEDAPPSATSVVFHFPQDEAAAQAVAELLSLGPSDVERLPIEPDTAPGAIEVRIVTR